MMKKIALMICLLVGLFIFQAQIPAHATTLGTYGFFNITGNNAIDAAIGEAQLFVDVEDVAGQPNQVLFNFYNIGPLPSSITDVYFDDGTLLGIAQLIDADDGIGGDSGVDFSQGASPPNLPGGNMVGFQVTAGFLADSDPPAQPNGVNPGEFLKIIFDLQSGQTANDVINDLNSDALRIGIHVQGFAGGGSESFVTSGSGEPPNIIPEPTTILLLGLGLLGIAGFRKKLRK